MGFRTGAYAKVWEISPMSDTSTKLRISISRKNKQTGEYEQDFSGFVLCIGSAAANSGIRNILLKLIRDMIQYISGNLLLIHTLTDAIRPPQRGLHHGILSGYILLPVEESPDILPRHP